MIYDDQLEIQYCVSNLILKCCTKLTWIQLNLALFCILHRPTIMNKKNGLTNLASSWREMYKFAAFVLKNQFHFRFDSTHTTYLLPTIFARYFSATESSKRLFRSMNRFPRFTWNPDSRNRLIKCGSRIQNHIAFLGIDSFRHRFSFRKKRNKKRLW